MNTPKKYRLVLASMAVALAASSGLTASQSAPASPGAAASGENKSDAATHVAKAAQVLQLMQKDRDLAALLNRSKGVFVVPDYGRVALGVGARGGAGVLLVRRGGTWADPAFYNMGGISAGLQAGAEAGALAFILNDQKALNGFMQENRFSLNADAGLTLVNWSAKDRTSARRGDITVWSDTEGLFGSAAIGVTDINFDENETAAYYNRRVAARDVLSGKVTDPHAAVLQQALAGFGGTAGNMGSSGTAGNTASGNKGNTQKKP